MSESARIQFANAHLFSLLNYGESWVKTCKMHFPSDKQILKQCSPVPKPNVLILIVCPTGAAVKAMPT